MRTRDLKPGFFRDLELTELPHITRLLFAGLWCCADRRGRLADIPKLIKSDVFPYENIPIEKHLKLLADHGFIERYEVNGQKCIWIARFKAHQKPHPSEVESVLPPHTKDPDQITAGGAPTSSSEEDLGDPSRSTLVDHDGAPTYSSDRASNLAIQQSSNLSPLGALSPLALQQSPDAAAERVQGLLDEWAQQIGTLPARYDDDFQRLALEAPDGWFTQAIERTKHEAKRAPWPYCAKVLRGCIDENIPPNGFSDSSNDNSARGQMMRRLAGAR